MMWTREMLRWGKDVRKYDLEVLREQVAVVLQKMFFFWYHLG